MLFRPALEDLGVVEQAIEHGGGGVAQQPFPIVDALIRHFGEAAACGELRAGIDAEAAARVCLTSVFGLFIGLPNEPAQRRTDFGLLFSLFLAEGTP